MAEIKMIRLIDKDQYDNTGKPIYEVLITFDNGTFDCIKYIPSLKVYHKGNRAMKKEIRNSYSQKEV